MMMLSTPLILASKSRIRYDILHHAGLDVVVKTQDIDERAMVQAEGGEHNFSPEKMALFLAGIKAKAISSQEGYASSLVIGCDQILGLEGQILHKAQNREEAFERIHNLQGKSHELYSAVSLYQRGEEIWQHCTICSLNMRPLYIDEINDYLDKAGEGVLNSVGCYQLETLGVQLFEAIEGDYFSILGLPLLPLLNYLHRYEKEQAQ